MNLPSGTITLLFTDIAGSTRLWQEHSQTMPSVLERHDALLRQAIEQNRGFVVKTIGDAFMAVFPTALDGVNAALTAQRSLCAEPWPQETPVQVRMGLHMGVTEERGNDYFGHEVNRAARIQAVVHPQQIVLSQAVATSARENLPEAVTLLDLGLHQLKDLRDPEHLWQLCHPDLPSPFPPLNSLTNWPNNLPPQLSSFVGREREMAAVKELSASSSCLSLIGAGGCGKTRLALQVAAERLPDYPHGVWLVELAALAEPSLVPQAIATVLGLREEPGKSLTQTLIEYVKSRTLLLVLDNCEHLLDACARCVATLLRLCPQVTVLATSREALNIGGEQTYRVPSMSLPDPKQAQTPITLQHYEASRLFVERATSVMADFVVTGNNAPALASVCQRLDGIPLAIELAAAWVRSLSVEEIHQRLDHRFRLLTGGSRTALPRQQTLRALIDWSYSLLTEKEKLLLCRLSVFAGGWTLSAAEQVCVGRGTSGEDIEDWDVLYLLMSLVEKSLVVADPQGQDTRYRLLETVRQYGREGLLEQGEGKGVWERHRDYFLGWAEEVEPKLSGLEQAQWLEALEAEHDNLRQALAFCLEEGEGGEAGLRLGASLCKFWAVRGHLSEGRGYLAAALERAKGAEEEGLPRARVVNGAGNLAAIQGDYVAARALYEESLTIRRELGDKNGIASSLNNLGILANIQGDYAAARTRYEESLTIRRELGDRDGLAHALGNLGVVAHNQGDLVAARALYEESLKLRRELGDKNSIAYSLNNLGVVALDQGDYVAAHVLYAESLTIFRELGDRDGIANGLDTYASFAHQEKQARRAAQLWGGATSLREAIGSARRPGDQERIDQEADQARAALGEAAFAAAFEEGLAMTWEKAVAYALGESL